MGLRFEVTTHPEFTVEELANQLANNLQNAANAQADVIVYQEQIRTEKRKIAEESILMDQIKTFRANPPAKISRMEPMMQYDLEMMEKELALTHDRISDWEKMIEEAIEITQECQKETIRLQKEIADQNSKK